METNKKKRLLLFIAIAYGMVAFVSIFMFIGTKMGNVVTWAEVPRLVLVTVVFAVFIFAPIYGKKKDEA